MHRMSCWPQNRPMQRAPAQTRRRPAQRTDYFASSRLTREQARDEAVSTLKELTESDTADQTAKDEAAAQISAMAEDSVAEANISRA